MKRTLQNQIKPADYAELVKTTKADLEKRKDRLVDAFDAAERRGRSRAKHLTRGMRDSDEVARDLALQALADAAGELGLMKEFGVYAGGDHLEN
jgi:ABC-type Na+ transport system ATPase subunit NatA